MYISKIQELIENGRVISQFAVMLQVSCNKPCWLSKLDVLGAHLSDLKSWMPDVGFKPFPPLGEGRRSSGFWVPSWLWVITMWVVGFMVTLCLSSSYLLPCRFFLIQPMWRSQSASLVFFFFFSRGIDSLHSCRFQCICGRNWVQDLPTTPSWIYLFIVSFWPTQEAIVKC